MKKKVIIPTVLLTAALAAGGLLYFPRNHLFKEVAAAATPPPAAPIVAGTVAQHDVPIYLTGVGTVIAYNTDIVSAALDASPLPGLRSTRASPYRFRKNCTCVKATGIARLVPGFLNGHRQPS
jgi:hypothetical protein